MSNIVLSLDVNDYEKFKEILLKCAKHIYALKTHIDIFPCTEQQKVIDLIIEQKRIHGFKVIEDRKFSDICKTNLEQFYALQIDKYADMVTCHAISGFEFCKQCPVPVLLIAQMSSKNNLINEEYTEKCIKEANENENVMGFICQKNLNVKNKLYFKPGVSLNNSTDGLDQLYSGKEKGIDYYIVGRGIYENNNSEMKLIKYVNYFKN